MKPKKKNLIISVLVVLVCIICYIGSPYIFGRSFSSFIGTNPDNITKVFMSYGVNSVCTTDKEKIKEIVKLVDGRRYLKVIDQTPRLGGSYVYHFYVGDKEVMYMGGYGKMVYVNNTTYYRVFPQISYDKLKEWFSSLPQKEWPDIAK